MSQTSPSVKAELDRLASEFFHAVSFETGDVPPLPEHLGPFHRAWPAHQEYRLHSRNLFGAGVHRASRGACRRSGTLTRFSESELSESTEVFGNVAHRFSAYAKSGTSGGVPFEARGMITTQFVHTPEGWRMSAMAWDDSDQDCPYPINGCWSFRQVAPNPSIERTLDHSE